MSKAEILPNRSEETAENPLIFPKIVEVEL